jgi:tetratricopeptide (TPR) repeat protein
MADRQLSRSIDPTPYASIASPIPLLALFGGIVELIISALVFGIAVEYQPYLIAGAILLPLAWLVVIFRLIARYHYHLYAPRDFSDPGHFLFTLSAETKTMLSKGTLGNPTDFGPFKLSEKASASGYKNIQNDIANTHRIDEFLSRMNGAELLALHAWYNENNAHAFALQTLTLTIAKGFIASKNYSYASASLRKLGRLLEAKAFAALALQLEGHNLDAKYNLSLICKAMGDSESALSYAKELLPEVGNYHRMRILQEFPSLKRTRTHDKEDPTESNKRMETDDP